LPLTVPAFSVLWGQQDEVSHHKRRYRLNQLLEKLDSMGFHRSAISILIICSFCRYWYAVSLCEFSRFMSLVKDK
jgi:hypothetical protein